MDYNDYAEIKATLAVHTERLNSIDVRMTEGFTDLATKLDAVASSVGARLTKVEDAVAPLVVDRERRSTRTKSTVKAVIAVLVLVAGGGIAHALGWGP